MRLRSEKVVAIEAAARDAFGGRVHDRSRDADVDRHVAWSEAWPAARAIMARRGVSVADRGYPR